MLFSHSCLLVQLSPSKQQIAPTGQERQPLCLKSPSDLEKWCLLSYLHPQTLLWQVDHYADFSKIRVCLSGLLTYRQNLNTYILDI